VNLYILLFCATPRGLVINIILQVTSRQWRCPDMLHYLPVTRKPMQVLLGHQRLIRLLGDQLPVWIFDTGLVMEPVWSLYPMSYIIRKEIDRKLFDFDPHNSPFKARAKILLLMYCKWVSVAVQCSYCAGKTQGNCSYISILLTTVVFHCLFLCVCHSDIAISFLGCLYSLC